MSETKSEKPIEIGFDSENNPADTASNYPCPLFNCRHTFIKLKHLKQHVLFHAGMLPHVCQVCGQGFKVVQNMEYHLVEKHQVDFQVSTMFNAKVGCCQGKIYTLWVLKNENIMVLLKIFNSTYKLSLIF